MKHIGDLRPMMDRLEKLRTDTRADLIALHGWSDDVSCAYCGDTGILPAQGRPQAARCDEPCRACETGRAIAERRHREEIWRESCPPRFKDYTLDTHPKPVAAAVVRQWLETGRHTGRNLVLFSAGAGTGKTGLAIAAIREISLEPAVIRMVSVDDPNDIRELGMDSRSVKFDTVPGLLDELRPRGDKDTGPIRAMDVMQSVPVLVMDDLGNEKWSEWVAEKIYLIVNGRYERGLPTIVTINRHADDIASITGERVASRLMEDALPLDMSGLDIRKGPSQPAQPKPSMRDRLRGAHSPQDAPKGQKR